MKYSAMKEIMDRCLALLILIILFLPMIMIGIVIKLNSKGPIFFKQRRVGINKTHFQIYKFRTMRMDAPKDCATHLLSNPEVFITKPGYILRKTSLDELPQLINILKGEMSFVGPRPALWNQYDLIKERDKYKANDIKPGLTGLAQVSGRDELSIKKKAKLDGFYVQYIGLSLDLWIVLKTAVNVLTKQGVVEGTGVNREREKNERENVR